MSGIGEDLKFWSQDSPPSVEPKPAFAPLISQALQSTRQVFRFSDCQAAASK